jgi:hypothetical protein
MRISNALKGHDFSRADRISKKPSALADEPWLSAPAALMIARIGRAILIGTIIAVCFAVCAPSWAKVESQGPIHLWRLHGLLVSPAGEPLANVAVTISRDNKLIAKTTTGSDGEFAFDKVYGHLQLHIDRTKYSPLDREVVVGIETADLARKMLYVIAGPGACSDDCSSVFTNKSEFHKTIQHNLQHNY